MSLVNIGLRILREKITTRTLTVGGGYTNSIDIWDGCNWLGSIYVYGYDGIVFEFDDEYDTNEVDRLCQVIERIHPQFRLEDAILEEAQAQGRNWSLSVEGNYKCKKLTITNENTQTTAVTFVYAPGKNTYNFKMRDRAVQGNSIAFLVSQIEFDLATEKTFFAEIERNFYGIVNNNNWTYRFDFEVKLESLGTITIGENSASATVMVIRSPIDRFSQGYKYVYAGCIYDAYDTRLGDDIKNMLSNDFADDYDY